MLQLSNISKEFGAKKAVQNVSFTAKSGEIYSLIGPNGSGKTTIVKMIAGLMRPTHGSITIDGIDIVKDPVKGKALIGYMPDEPQVWEKITGEEFLHLTGSLFGMSEKERTTQIQELLPVFHLEGMEKDYFGSYSRGSRQKFSILAGLLHNPKLLLIDEPMVGLDPTSTETAKKLFRNFAEKGGTVLLVTHALPVAEELSNTIGVLEQSTLIVGGTFAELQSKASLPASASLEEVYEKLI
jgi:ABC-2 type transport system ATP-binding protein